MNKKYLIFTFALTCLFNTLNCMFENFNTDNPN